MQYTHVGLRPGSEDNLEVFCFERAPQAPQSLGINICLNESILNVEIDDEAVQRRSYQYSSLKALEFRVRRKFLAQVPLKCWIAGSTSDTGTTPSGALPNLEQMLTHEAL